MRLEEGMKKAISEFSKTIITEPRFVNILSDYGVFQNDQSVKFVIHTLLDDSYLRKFLSSENSKYDITFLTNKYTTDICKTYPFREDVVKQVVISILQATSGKAYHTQCSGGTSSCTNITGNDYLNQTDRIAEIYHPKLGLKDLAQIGEFILGSSHVSNVDNQGYDTISGEFCTSWQLPNDSGWISSLRSKNRILNQYHAYNFHAFPKTWQLLGFDKNKSYNEWVHLLTKYGFKQTEDRQVDILVIHKVTRYTTFVSYDNTIELKIIFESTEYMFQDNASGTLNKIVATALTKYLMLLSKYRKNDY